ncbi:cation diffusion facilitator family transporter [Lachnospiraceae bacterium C7]|nr:cation diffusion facilitator family transporter [Lachnospiraceae bacterium C7]
MGILEKIFIKEEMNMTEKRSAYGILCGILGIIFNVFLSATKFFAGTISNSIAITADAVNNLSDAGSSIVTLVGFKMASQKADPDHPFGHGRIEYASGFVVAILIILMAIELIQSSIAKIINPEKQTVSAIVICILVTSILVKCYMAFYNRRIGKKINSPALEANAIDSLSDCVATSVVLITSLVGRFYHIYLDGYAGVLVGIFIMYAGITAAKETINPLLGQPPEPEYVDKIIDIVTHFDEENIVGIHDLIVHDYGPGRQIVSLHAEVPEDGNMVELHEIIDDLENKLNEEMGCQVTIHMDPVFTKNEYVLSVKKTVNEIVSEIGTDIGFKFSIHDFRVMKNNNTTKLFFDVVIPYKCVVSDSQIKALITQKINEKLGDDYLVVIHVDMDFTK